MYLKEEGYAELLSKGNNTEKQVHCFFLQFKATSNSFTWRHILREFRLKHRSNLLKQFCFYSSNTIQSIRFVCVNDVAVIEGTKYTEFSSYLVRRFGTSEFDVCTSLCTRAQQENPKPKKKLVLVFFCRVASTFWIVKFFILSITETRSLASASA